MATYLYKCKNCEKECQIMHSMSEIDNPSEETVIKTSCNESTCNVVKSQEVNYGERWIRVPQSFGMNADKLVNNKSKRDKFQKERSKRSSKNFEQDVLPGLKAGERRHFLKKRGFKS